MFPGHIQPWAFWTHDLFSYLWSSLTGGSFFPFLLNSPLFRKAAPASPQPLHPAVLRPCGFLIQIITLACSTICFHSYGLILSPRWLSSPRLINFIFPTLGIEPAQLKKKRLLFSKTRKTTNGWLGKQTKTKKTQTTFYNAGFTSSKAPPSAVRMQWCSFKKSNRTETQRIYKTP